MADIVIKKIPIFHSGRLYYLFDQALEEDFAYFSPSYRQNVRRTNNINKIRLGTIHPYRLFMGIYQNNQLEGYSISGIQKSNMRAFLYWLYIVPALRKKQLGQLLLSETERGLKARKVDSIELVTHNQQHFYERSGYDINKILTDIDTDVDMYLMSKVGI